MATERWGADIYVNGPGAGDHPHITALADGRFVVAWVDTITQEVRAQILNADGTPKGAQFTINSVPTGEQQFPTIAALPDGRWVAVWTDQRDHLDDGENAAIYGQIFDVNGAKVGDEFKISEGTGVPPAHALMQPGLTVLDDGSFAVTWRDYEPANGEDYVEMWVARYDNSGAQIGAVQSLGTTRNDQNAKPVIQALGNGTFVVAWSQATATSAVNLFAQIVDANGATVVDLGNIGIPYDPSEDVVQINPQITRLANGGFVVTWKVNDGTGGGADYAVWARVFDAAGVPQAAAFEVVNATGVGPDSLEIDPVVTALKDGRFMISWADFHDYGTLATEVKGQIYSATGQKDGNAFTVHTPGVVNDRMPSITTLEDGRVAIAWRHDGAPTVRAQIIDSREEAIELSPNTLSAIKISLNNDWVGTRFNDVFDAGEGDDQIEGGAGADIINGGVGFDTVTFANAKSGVTATMTGGSRGDAAGDQYTSIERLIGSRYADILTGNGAAVLQGGAGNDTYYVRAGDQVVENAGGGKDVVIVTSGTSFKLSASSEVEEIRFTSASSKKSYSFTGSNAANTLKGSAGKDKLSGAGGNDKLYGGSGNDTLSGGTGKDIFVFNTKLGTSKTDRKVNFDTIKDFSVRDDSIWLDNAIFKKLGSGTASKPKQLKSSYFAIDKAKDKNDYIIYNKKTGILSYDADGSGSKAAIEIAKLSKNLKLTYKDFFVI